MPIYDYRCVDCKETFEARRGMFDPTCPTCPECGGDTEKVIVGTPASILDWKDSDSVHASTRFRPRTVAQRR